MEKFSCDRRVKWRTTCSSLTSGSSGGARGADAAGRSSTRAALRLPATGRVAPRPGCECSKISGLTHAFSAHAAARGLQHVAQCGA